MHKIKFAKKNVHMPIKHTSNMHVTFLFLFSIVKLGFTGVYIIFLFLLLNIDNDLIVGTHNQCFEQK